jgi:6-phosphogluconolactonase
MADFSLIVGGYTDETSQGVYRLNYDAQAHSFSQAILLANTHNPSIALKHGALWYVVEEADPGKVHAFQTDANDSWNRLATLDSGGASPCHLAINTSASHLAVANYMGGSIAIFSLNETGLPQSPPQVIRHNGCGLTARQEAPHAHYVVFADNYAQQQGIYAVDLGLDQIIWYGQIHPDVWGDAQIVLRAPAGDGPRHMAIHPTNGKIYVLNELSNILSVHEVTADGSWYTLQRVSTLPASFNGENISAHIIISENGQYVYTSNRGHHSIAVFKIRVDGTLELIQIQPCGGLWPRYFTFLDAGTRLIVAHEHSNSLAAFIVELDGCLQDTQARGSVHRPTFVSEA